MRVQYAQFQVKDADIGTEFGLQWATKLFGQEVIEILQRDLEKDARRIERAAASVVKWEADLAALPEADEPEETKECAA